MKPFECKGPHNVRQTDYRVDVGSLVLEMHVTDVTLGVYEQNLKGGFLDFGFRYLVVVSHSVFKIFRNKHFLIS